MFQFWATADRSRPRPDRTAPSPTRPARGGVARELLVQPARRRDLARQRVEVGSVRRADSRGAGERRGDVAARCPRGDGPVGPSQSASRRQVRRSARRPSPTATVSASYDRRVARPRSRRRAAEERDRLGQRRVHRGRAARLGDRRQRDRSGPRGSPARPVAQLRRAATPATHADDRLRSANRQPGEHVRRPARAAPRRARRRLRRRRPGCRRPPSPCRSARPGGRRSRAAAATSTIAAASSDAQPASRSRRRATPTPMTPYVSLTRAARRPNAPRRPSGS